MATNILPSSAQSNTLADERTSNLHRVSEKVLQGSVDTLVR